MAVMEEYTVCEWSWCLDLAVGDIGRSPAVLSGDGTHRSLGHLNGLGMQCLTPVAVGRSIHCEDLLLDVGALLQIGLWSASCSVLSPLRGVQLKTVQQQIKAIQGLAFKARLSVALGSLV